MTTAARVEQLVAEVAQRHPHRPALAGPDETVDFAELERRASVLADRLRQAGVTAGQAVAVRMPRSVEHAVAILACWKAGAVCVPIDPGTPRRRVDTMLSITSACAVIEPGGQISPLDGDGVLDPDLAYVFFTSGSTSEPKAVGTPHSGIINEALWTAEDFDLSEQDRGSWLSSPGFAISRWELWSSLTAGVCVAVAGEGVEWSEASTRDWLAQAGVTWAIVVTSLGERLFDLDWAQGGSLRLLVTGGEQLRKWPSNLPFEVVNAYGVTETSGVRAVAWLPRTPPSEGMPPVGKAIANTRLYVLDDKFAPVPSGQTGELFVAGDGLSPGYLGQPELTEERFLADPFGPAGSRMYRTGDLAVVNGDGDLEIIGRIGAGAKIDGVRVDFAEIEASLLAHPAVSMAAAELNPGLGLVAHVVGDELSPNDLRSFLAGRLPRALVPTAFVSATTLPTLPSGKIDRSRLPQPGPDNLLKDPYVGPRDDVEREVVRAFQAALGAEHAISGHEDFFAIGGDSLAMAQVRTTLAEHFGVTMPMAVLFECRTPIRIAAALRTFVADSAGQEPRWRELPGDQPRKVPLTSGQRGIWFQEEMYPDSARYLEVITVWLSGAVNVERLQRALQDLVAVHPALRTAFADEGSEVVQVVHPAAQCELRIADVAPTTYDDVLADLAKANQLEPMDLGRAPLMRGQLYRGESESLLAIVIHHLVWDGTSAEVLVRDLAALYDGGPVTVNPVLVGDGEASAADLAYWVEELAGAPKVTWADPVPETGRMGVVELPVPPDAVTAMRSLAETLGITPHMIGVGCLALALRRFHSSDEIVVSSPASVRPDQAAGSIGLHVNMLPLRLRLSGHVTGRKFFESVRRTCLDAWDHRDVPFDRVVADTTHGRRSSAEPPYSQVMFCYNRFPRLVSSVDNVGWRVDHLPSRAPKCSLMVSWNDKSTGWTIRVEHATDRIDRTTAENLADGMVGLLAALAGKPDTTLAALPGFPTAGAPAVPTRAAAGVSVEDVRRESVPAQGEKDAIAEQIAQMWCSVLGVSAVSDSDHFFDQGGRSMAAMRLVTMVRSTLGLRVPVRDVFDTDSFAEFVALVRERLSARSPKG
ncbi:hypothetical protein DMH04_27415 [Kibdelosporangium aridum]|uniref:Carrier domain-containing protein n=1 Tax=Kibdelosporangium aridum TaxID=2030 RepID=A0A428Z4S2_KIBAR|nr:acyl carrier protein [Kibdelosporangium aridum]RSM81610.1 hypothetical protein DMH04_27415 [Kibdelosporangium aridum]